MAKTHVPNRYGVTPNDVLNNKDLSLKAKGLYGYIQSKPEDWSFTLNKIASQNKEGVESIRGAVRELEEAGYLTRYNYQNAKGQWECDYILHIIKMKPEPLTKPHTDEPHVGEPYREKPYTENPHTLVIKNSKQEEVKKNTNNGAKAPDEIPLIIKAFEDIDPKNKTYYGHKGQRTACAFLLKEYGLDTVLDAIANLKMIYSATETPAYFPSINSPYDLKEKWLKVTQYVKREQTKNKTLTNNMMW
jgi:hypothetical protein